MYRQIQKPSIAHTIAGHIRSFYRLLFMLSIILLIAMVGGAAVFLGEKHIDSCSSSYYTLKWLVVSGMIEILVCVFIALIVCKMKFIILIYMYNYLDYCKCDLLSYRQYYYLVLY